MENIIWDALPPPFTIKNVDYDLKENINESSEMFKRALKGNKFIIVIWITLLLSGSLAAQEVISSAGDSYHNSSAQVDFTVGELSIETYVSEATIATQGFHQTFQKIITGLTPISKPVTTSVYPNPTADFLKIEVFDFEEDIHYRLCDLNGVSLNAGKFTSKHELNLLDYADGIYLLILTNTRKQLIQSFKIQIK